MRCLAMAASLALSADANDCAGSYRRGSGRSTAFDRSRLLWNETPCKRLPRADARRGKESAAMGKEPREPKAISRDQVPDAQALKPGYDWSRQIPAHGHSA